MAVVLDRVLFVDPPSEAFADRKTTRVFPTVTRIDVDVDRTAVRGFDAPATAESPEPVERAADLGLRAAAAKAEDASA
jgi:hypothetical protein